MRIHFFCSDHLTVKRMTALGIWRWVKNIISWAASPHQQYPFFRSRSSLCWHQQSPPPQKKKESSEGRKGHTRLWGSIFRRAESAEFAGGGKPQMGRGLKSFVTVLVTKTLFDASRLYTRHPSATKSEKLFYECSSWLWENRVCVLCRLRKTAIAHALTACTVREGTKTWSALSQQKPFLKGGWREGRKVGLISTLFFYLADAYYSFLSFCRSFSTSSFFSIIPLLS